MTDERKSESGAGNGRRIGIMVLGGTAVLLLLTLALILIDPFGWHIIGRFQGEYDAALQAIPADSTVYVGVNLLNTNLTRLNEIRDTFAAASAESDADFEQLRQEIDEALGQELNISIEEDVVPWLGQYIGFAIVSFELDELGQLVAFEWVLTAESRNQAASDQFLSKLAQGWADSSGETAVLATYNNISLTQFEDIVFGRSQTLVIFGSSVEAIQQAIDAQGGDSLADTPGYGDALAQLPDDRLLTTFINGDQLNRLLAAVPTLLPRISPHNLPTAPILGTAVSLSLVADGIQIDTATAYDPAQLSVLQRTTLETRNTELETAVLFPQDTLLYLTGKGVDLAWANLRRSLTAELGRADFQESMRLFAQEFNINPDEELFPYLDGEAALGIVPSDKGTLALTSQIDLGAVALIGSGDQATLAANIATFSDKIGAAQGGLGTITPIETQTGLTLYDFETALVPDFFITYGIGRGYMLLGSSAETLQSLHFAGGPSLAERPDFQRVRASFPAEMSLGLFVDVPGILNVVRASEQVDAAAFEAVTAVLRPIPHIAAASTVNDNIAQTRLIIFVETGP